MNSEKLENLPPPPAYDPNWDIARIVDTQPKAVGENRSSSSSITVRLSIVKPDLETNL